MLPVLLDLPYLKIYTFGVFLVLAFFWATFLLWKYFLLTSYKEEEMFDCVFLSLAGGLFFSRFIYVALHFNKFGFNLLKFVLINGYPGLSLYGFIAGFILVLYLFLQSKRYKFFEVTDYFAPSAFLALGFGKLGAFFSGAEIGSKTNFFLRFKYVGADGMRHLTPMYEALLFFFAAFVSYRLLFAIRRERFPKGANLLFFIWFFSFVYAVFDMFKSTHTTVIGVFSFNAILSYVLLLTLSIYFLYYFRSLIGKTIKNYGKGIFKSVRKQTKGSNRKG